MIDLYFIPGAASFAVHILLEELGLEYRLRRVEREAGRVTPPDFVGLSPHGRVPVLVDGDLVLHESAAIVMHLCDVYPEAGLAPGPGTRERAHWYRWLVYMTNTVQPAFLRYFYPERYAADEAVAPAVGARAAAELDETRAFIERELARSGPYLLGERFSSADVFLLMLTRWGRRLPEKWWDQPTLRAHFAGSSSVLPSSVPGSRKGSTPGTALRADPALARDSRHGFGATGRSGARGGYRLSASSPRAREAGNARLLARR